MASTYSVRQFFVQATIVRCRFASYIKYLAFMSAMLRQHNAGMIFAAFGPHERSTSFARGSVRDGAATVGGVILESTVFPVNFAILFGIAGLSIVISWFFLAQVREPVEAVNVPRRSSAQVERSPGGINTDSSLACRGR